MINEVKFQCHEFTIRQLKYTVKDTPIFFPGDFVRVYGANGVGKTSLFESICIEEDVKFDKNTTIFYIPQNYENNIYVGRNVLNFVVGYLQTKNKSEKSQAYRVFESFYHDSKSHLAENYKSYTKRGEPKIFSFKSFCRLQLNNMSGGQKRLLYIIREYLAIQEHNSEQPMLFLDEPFNDLDQKNKIFALKLIESLRNKNPNLITFIITHMPIVKGLTKLIRLVARDQGVVEVFDDTIKNRPLLNVCTCLIESMPFD